MGSEAKYEGHPVKFEGGEWGARVSNVSRADVRVGDTIRMRAGNGKTWSATVAAIIDEDAWGLTCATAKAPAQGTAPAPRVPQQAPLATYVHAAGETVNVIEDTTAGNPDCPF